jgi:hypothetical protein
MPTLPTFNVTDAQATRITAAFGSVANYKEWLRQSIIDAVFDYERRQMQTTFDSEIQNKRTEITNDLGTAT